jgi:hypothetical protein
LLKETFFGEEIYTGFWFGARQETLDVRLDGFFMLVGSIRVALLIYVAAICGNPCVNAAAFMSSCTKTDIPKRQVQQLRAPFRSRRDERLDWIIAPVQCQGIKVL